MKYIKNTLSFETQRGSVVTLGKFDGLHLGHQKLIDKIRAYASDECETVVCAFDMHRESLMTGRERREHLENRVDWLIEQPFTKEVREMEAEKFIEDVLCKTLKAAHIVVGTDFNFGYGKRGDAKMLLEYAGKYGYTVDVLEKERYLGTVISSTYIKDFIYLGTVRDIPEEARRPELQGYVEISQKNKFFVGDRITIMHRDMTDSEALVEDMLSADSLEHMDSCPHPGQSIYLRLSEKPVCGEVLRMRAARQ